METCKPYEENQDCYSVAAHKYEKKAALLFIGINETNTAKSIEF